MNVAPYVPETDLAWVACLIYTTLSHDKKKYWHEYPDYTRMEARRLGISAACIREMRKL